jgi:hypothetical protein
MGMKRFLSVYVVSVETLHDRREESLQEELMYDFMAVLASPSGRFCRLRFAHSQRRLLEAADERLGSERG